MHPYLKVLRFLKVETAPRGRRETFLLTPFVWCVFLNFFCFASSQGPFLHLHTNKTSYSIIQMLNVAVVILLSALPAVVSFKGASFNRRSIHLLSLSRGSLLATNAGANGGKLPPNGNDFLTISDDNDDDDKRAKSSSSESKELVLLGGGAGIGFIGALIDKFLSGFKKRSIYVLNTAIL